MGIDIRNQLTCTEIDSIISALKKCYVYDRPLAKIIDKLDAMKWDGERLNPRECEILKQCMREW